MGVQVHKWGEAAATLGWRAEVIRRLMAVPVVLMVVAFALAGTYWGWLFGSGAVLAAADAIAFVIVTGRMYRIATKHLGVPIGWRSAPPSSPKDYEAWCTRSGIRPYDAG